MAASISKTKRAQVLAKTHGHCHYCWCPLPGHWEVDHVIPQSRGGRNNIENLVPACNTCNCAKGDRIFPDLDCSEDFMREVYG